MYKILEKNQIIDVIEEPQFIKYLPKTKKTISVDERQANGLLSSDGTVIYHINGTNNTFSQEVKTVSYIRINQEEFDRLTKQLKENQELINRVRDLEKIVEELKAKLL